METHLRTELVLEALNMALAQRRPAGFRPGHTVHVDRLRNALPVWCPAFDGYQSEIASTMRCARAFSLRSNASCSTAATFALRSRRAWRCSSSSKAGITRIAVTPPSTKGADTGSPDFSLVQSG